MIIKSMSRKTASFGQLLQYINAPELKGDSLAHNLISDPEDTSSVLGEFLGNARLLKQRKRGNALFHEVLSFAPDDASALNATVIEDLTRRYLDLRAPRALAYARAHFDVPCPHVHIVISSNDVSSSRRNRLSRSRFAQVKRELERYQLEKCPQLRHSLAHQEKKQGRPNSRREDERLRRRKRQGKSSASAKEILKAKVRSMLRTSWSVGDFVSRLRGLGLEMYVRGRHAGIVDSQSGRRYRFKTLGLDGDLSLQRESWAQMVGRMSRIDAINLELRARVVVSMGFRAEAALVLAEDRPEDGLPGERKRLEGLRRESAAVRARRIRSEEPALEPGD